MTIETVVDPTGNTQLMGLYRAGATYCTQCEAEGFRRITYFLDRPDVMAVYTTRIEADKKEAPVLLSNGNLVAHGDLAGTARHFAVWHDPFPKPSYLFALVGGNLGCVEDSFTTMSGRKVKLAIYVEPGKEDRCAYAMDSLKRAMRWDETAFGREYDLDIFMIVAVSAFNMGAMENKGLNVFNDKYVLASPASATDADYAGIEAVIAHEYFHNWTGDRITCRDWFQLCLKEGLTVFRDQEFTADQRSRAVERISDVRGLRAHQFVEDAGPLAHPVRPEVYREINNFYTSTVYEKGAEVVRMIRTLLGPATFRKGMDLYFTRHDGQAATVEQFVQCFADASRRDMAQFMRWYSQAGTPDIKVGAALRRAGEDLQARYHADGAADAWPAEKRADGDPARARIGRRQRRRSAACGQWRASRPRRNRADAAKAEFLVHRDPGTAGTFAQPRLFRADQAHAAGRARRFAFPRRARFRSVQSLAGGADFGHDLLKANVTSLRGGGPAREDDGLMAALGAILNDAKLEPAYIALTLSPPSEADIARELGGDVDPDAVFAARRKLRAAIGARHGAPLAETYQRMITPGPYRPDAQSAGRRALKNICLDLLAMTETEPGDRARLRPISKRRQYDRPHGCAGDARAA